MTTIYLHIGMPKTGTTSLQKFLFENREKLLEKGYLYPLSGTLPNSEHIEDGYNHHGLARQLNKDNLVSLVGSWADLKREINTIKPKKVLISSEVLSFHYNIDKIALIKKMLEEYETIKIVIYLRRQDEYVRSLYCQRVKRSHWSIGNIQDFILNYKNKLNYYSMLEALKKSFGSENIIVRIFEKEQMKGCCIVDDFLNAINLNLDNEYQLKWRNSIAKNITPSGRAIKLIFLLDKMIPIKRFGQIEKKMPWWYSSAFFRVFREYRSLRTKLAIVMSRFIPNFLINEELLSKEDRISIMEEFEESNRKVAQEYLGREDGILFYSKP